MNNGKPWYVEQNGSTFYIRKQPTNPLFKPIAVCVVGSSREDAELIVAAVNAYNLENPVEV